MTVEEMLSAIREWLTGPSSGLVAIRSVEPRPNDWLRVTFDNGQTLAVTVEEL